MGLIIIFLIRLYIIEIEKIHNHAKMKMICRIGEWDLFQNCHFILHHITNSKRIIQFSMRMNGSWPMGETERQGREVLM